MEIFTHSILIDSGSNIAHKWNNILFKNGYNEKTIKVNIFIDLINKDDSLVNSTTKIDINCTTSKNKFIFTLVKNKKDILDNDCTIYKDTDIISAEGADRVEVYYQFIEGCDYWRINEDILQICHNIDIGFYYSKFYGKPWNIVVIIPDIEETISKRSLKLGDENIINFAIYKEASKEDGIIDQSDLNNFFTEVKNKERSIYYKIVSNN